MVWIHNAAYFRKGKLRPLNILEKRFISTSSKLSNVVKIDLEVQEGKYLIVWYRGRQVLNDVSSQIDDCNLQEKDIDKSIKTYHLNSMSM